MKKADELQSRKLSADRSDERTITDLLLDQVEFANVILLNKADLCDPTELLELEAFLRSLNPDARLIRTSQCQVATEEILNTRLFDLDQASRQQDR